MMARSAWLILLMAPPFGCASADNDDPFGGNTQASLSPSESGGTATGASADSTGQPEADTTSGGDTAESGDGPSSGSASDPATGEGTTTGVNPTTGVDTAVGETTGTEDALPFTLDEVIWLYPDISDWAETITLSSITLEGDLLCMDHDIATQNPAWPIVLAFETTEVVGNAWVFIEQDGQWYAATWEWLRPPGQECKFATAVAGDHIKVNPFGENSGWTPTPGQSYYFMVSGLIRNPSYANVMERSNIVEYVWH